MNAGGWSAPLRSSDGDAVACLGSEEVTIVGPAAGVARDTQIVFTKTVPSNSPGCRADIQVTSSGLGAQFFSGPGSSPRSQATTRDVLVLPPLKPGRLITFIVHGLSDNPGSFVGIRDRLSIRLSQGFPSIEESRFVFDLTGVQISWKPLGVELKAKDLRC